MMLALEIMKPDGCLLRTDVRSVRATDVTGSFGLLPGHEDFCTALVPSILTYRDASGAPRYAAVDGGVLVLEDHQVAVVTRDAVLADDLDQVSVEVEALLRERTKNEQEAARTFNTLVAELLEQLPQVRMRK